MRDENTGDRQAGEFYAKWLLSSKGQELIGRAGYVPLH